MSGVRPDHQAILDLLAAFGIDSQNVVTVHIHSAVAERTRVSVDRYVSTTDPTKVHRTYEVTATEIGA